MNTWPSIHREGALALCPHDVAEGNRALNAIIKSAALSVAKRETLFAFAYALWVAVLIMGSVVWLAYAYREPPVPLERNLATAAISVSLMMLALLWWAWFAIQHGRIGQRLGSLSGVAIPEPLQRLIDSFASGVRDARTASGNTVLPDLFASRWAIMLFSHDPRHRQLVRCSRGTKRKEEIFARPVAPDPDSSGYASVTRDGPEGQLRNGDPTMAWLLGGTLERFAAGLDAFLDTLPPHQMDAYRAILTIARRELRKGGHSGAQEAAIRTIQAELAERDLLIRGTSRASIMKLLHGQHGTTDIKRYFI
jgi:hypothetical protein